MRNYDIHTLDSCPDVLTVVEVSKILRFGINKTYDLVRSGKIKRVKVGRQYRIPRQAVLDYLGLSNPDNYA